MTKTKDFETLVAHLTDLKDKTEVWQCSLSSDYLEEAEIAQLQTIFPPSSKIIYFGGYPDAMKQKVIFSPFGEDDFSSIVCLEGKIDQRFRKIGHRDILGALMGLQVERSSFGDFWVEEEAIYLYTSPSMVDFFQTYLVQINQLKVHWLVLDTFPSYQRAFKEMELVVASQRLDAMVASLSKTSREKAKNLIKAGFVRCNHEVIEDASKLCNNGTTISIRGKGRFKFVELLRETKSGRQVALFKQYI